MGKCFLSSLPRLCTMKTWSRSSHLLLKLIYITLLPVLEAQEVSVSHEVIGYLGHEVTLPCQFIQGPQAANITQVQWDFRPPEGVTNIIIVANKEYGRNIPESPLKGRLELAEESLMITDVQMADAGPYTCTIVTYPSGSLQGTTNLVVEEQLLLSTGVVSAIVTAVVLLLAITATMVYLFFIRRHDSSVRHRVFIDTAGPVIGVARPSIIVGEEDVVYLEVKHKPSRDATATTNDRGTAHGDDVTYSEVVVSRLQSK